MSNDHSTHFLRAATCVACRVPIHELLADCSIYRLEPCHHLMCSECYHHPLTMVISYGCTACGTLPSHYTLMVEVVESPSSLVTAAAQPRSPSCPSTIVHPNKQEEEKAEEEISNTFVLDFFSQSTSITKRNKQQEEEDTWLSFLDNGGINQPAPVASTISEGDYYYSPRGDNSEQEKDEESDDLPLICELFASDSHTSTTTDATLVSFTSPAAEQQTIFKAFPTTRETIISPVEIRNPDRQGKLLVEWRVKDPKIIQQLVQVQDHLVAISGGTLEVLPSCAGGNLHITMIEFTDPQDHPLLLSSEGTAAASALIDSISEAWRTTSGSNGFSDEIHRGSNVTIGGLDHFNKRVIYTPITGPGRDILSDAQKLVIEILSSLGLIDKAKGNNKDLKRTFTPHITLCKLKNGATKVPRAVENFLTNSKLLYSNSSSSTNFTSSTTTTIDTAAGNLTTGVGVLGHEEAGSIVLCCKRLKKESTPPVLLELKL